MDGKFTVGICATVEYSRVLLVTFSALGKWVSLAEVQEMRLWHFCGALHHVRPGRRAGVVENDDRRIPIDFRHWGIIMNNLTMGKLPSREKIGPVHHTIFKGKN